MKTIFYSWQSDVNRARSKIAKALEIVSKNLNDKLELADRPEIDSDTKGTYGSEEIISTIFSKIDDCSVFVADVTPIATTGSKLIPNPNVMTELGYALKAKPKFSRLYIYISDEKIDEGKMPFDIRGKSLHGFSSEDTPTQIAARVEPMIEQMLKNRGFKDTKISLLKEAGGGWANWGGYGMGSGFRYKISIDNFHGPLDYIDDIYIKATNEWGDPWRTSYFIFEGQEGNQKLRIEPSEMKDMWVFTTDAPGQTQRPVPAIDISPLYLAIRLKGDGNERLLEIPATLFVNR